MFDITQIVNKKISLPEGWRDNNYEGYNNYVFEAHAIQKAISEMLTNESIDVVKIDMDINVHIKTKDKSINQSDLVENIVLEVQDKIDD